MLMLLLLDCYFVILVPFFLSSFLFLSSSDSLRDPTDLSFTADPP